MKFETYIKSVISITAEQTAVQFVNILSLRISGLCF